MLHLPGTSTSSETDAKQGRRISPQIFAWFSLRLMLSLMKLATSEICSMADWSMGRSGCSFSVFLSIPSSSSLYLVNPPQPVSHEPELHSHHVKSYVVGYIPARTSSRSKLRLLCARSRRLETNKDIERYLTVSIPAMGLHRWSSAKGNRTAGEITPKPTSR